MWQYLYGALGSALTYTGLSRIKSKEPIRILIAVLIGLLIILLFQKQVEGFYADTPYSGTLRLMQRGDRSFFENNIAIAVYNNNYTNDGFRNGTQYIGGGLPEDGSAVGYKITGPGVPPGTVITSYRAGTSDPSSMYNVFFIYLSNRVADSATTFTYLSPNPPPPPPPPPPVPVCPVCPPPPPPTVCPPPPPPTVCPPPPPPTVCPPPPPPTVCPPPPPPTVCPPPPPPTVCPPQKVCPPPTLCPPEKICPPPTACPPEKVCPPPTVCPKPKICPVCEPDSGLVAVSLKNPCHAPIEEDMYSVDPKSCRALHGASDTLHGCKF